MIGDRLLRIARALYGEKTAQQVFEPLVADFQRDCGPANSSRMLHRLRWRVAIAQTFVFCLPRAFGFRMPTVLLLEVIGCAVCLPLVALVMQWRDLQIAGNDEFGWRFMLVGSLWFTFAMAWLTAFTLKKRFNGFTSIGP